MRVAPFGNLRIEAHLRLPAAYRSLSRPSSAPSAKASALRPSSLDHLSVFCKDGSSLVSLARTLFPVSPGRPPVSPGCPLDRYLPITTSIVFPICVFAHAPFSFRCTLLQDYFVYAVFKVRPWPLPCIPSLQKIRVGMRFAPRTLCGTPFKAFFLILAAACSPAPSPAQYHRPYAS